MTSTLVLNFSYEPLKIVPWERAVTLWVQGKAEIVEEYDRIVRSVSFSFKLPSVIRLLKYVRLRRRPAVAFTRANIYIRDSFQCQYCGTEHEPEDLTFDHVVPVAQGGRRGWTNIVAACQPCNRKKGARTPTEAGMTLLREPRQPKVLPLSTKMGGQWKTPEAWSSLIYWNVALDQK